MGWLRWKDVDVLRRDNPDGRENQAYSNQDTDPVAEFAMKAGPAILPDYPRIEQATTSTYGRIERITFITFK
jgi:hypothetical protein